MKINLYENKNVQIALLNALAGNTELLDKIIKARTSNDGTDEIEFIINGIELDFKDFIDSFAERWNRLVELKALKILEEKYNSMLKSIYDIQEELEYQHNKICGYEED